MKTLFCMAVLLMALASKAGMALDENGPDVAGKCMACHKEKSPGLYRQW